MHPSWFKSQEILCIVRTKPAQNKLIFMRLHYPDNHVSNYLEPSVGSRHRSGMANPPPPCVLDNSNHQLNPPKRVLRWIQKKGANNPRIQRVAFFKIQMPGLHLR
jgi:hypothetical protein